MVDLRKELNYQIFKMINLMLLRLYYEQALVKF